MRVAADVLLIWQQSAGMSDLYASSRTLYGLAVDHKAPAIFRKCLSNGLPIYSVAATSLFGLLAYSTSASGPFAPDLLTLATVTVSENAGQVFTWLANLGSITGLIAWSCISGTFIRYYHGCKVQGIDRNLLAYKAPFQASCHHLYQRQKC